jgi:hypothetical protein
MKKFSALVTINLLKGLMYLFFSIVFLSSCKKERSYSYIAPNEKPVAVTGPDLVIGFDSVLLSGGNSYKNGGAITSYLWTKIYGPDTFNIKSPTEAKTLVNNLIRGV